ARPGADLRRAAQGRLRLHARQPRQARREDHRRLGRLQHADGPVRHEEGDRGLRGAAEEGAGRLHRAAADRALVAPDVRRRALRAASHRPAPVHPLRRVDPRAAGRPHARGAAPGLLRRQLVAGRRQQGHLGAGSARRLMLSRVADAVYWMGRYLERSENIARLLLVTDDFSTETQGLAEQVAQSAWKDLLAIFPSAQGAPPASAFAPMSQAYLGGFFLDGGNPYSVHYSLRKARENARSVREALTVEAFLAINETFRTLEDHARRKLTDPTALRDALAATHKG